MPEPHEQPRRGKRDGETNEKKREDRAEHLAVRYTR
jgi:hypothetical protein